MHIEPMFPIFMVRPWLLGVVFICLGAILGYIARELHSYWRRGA